MQIQTKLPKVGTTIFTLMSQLAEQHGARSVAVILSGSGSDGSRGIRRVNAQGGLYALLKSTIIFPSFGGAA